MCVCFKIILLFHTFFQCVYLFLFHCLFFCFFLYCMLFIFIWFGGPLLLFSFYWLFSSCMQFFSVLLPFSATFTLTVLTYCNLKIKKTVCFTYCFYLFYFVVLFLVFCCDRNFQCFRVMTTLFEIMHFIYCCITILC